MPSELSNILKDTCGWSFSSRGLNNIFCNKFYTSAVATILILILIMIIYPCKKGTPAWITFKLGFYILLSTLSIIFIHDGVMYGLYEKEKAGGETDAFINALSRENNVAFKNDSLLIKPAIGNVSGGDSAVSDGTPRLSEPENMSSSDVFNMYGV